MFDIWWGIKIAIWLTADPDISLYIFIRQVNIISLYGRFLFVFVGWASPLTYCGTSNSFYQWGCTSNEIFVRNLGWASPFIHIYVYMDIRMHMVCLHIFYTSVGSLNFIFSVHFAYPLPIGGISGCWACCSGRKKCSSFSSLQNIGRRAHWIAISCSSNPCFQSLCPFHLS